MVLSPVPVRVQAPGHQSVQCNVFLCGTRQQLEDYEGDQAGSEHVGRAAADFWKKGRRDIAAAGCDARFYRDGPGSVGAAIHGR